MRFPIPAFSAILLLTACGAARKIDTCPPDVICTRIFKSVGIHITEQSTAPVRLDEAYTLNVATGEVIHLQSTGQAGFYTVLDDSYQKKMPNRTLRFQFVGIRGGQRIVEESFTIAADCCHISKVSGREEVVIK